MRKQLIFLSIMVSVMPFTFYELDGPFGIRKGIEERIVSEATHRLIKPIEQLTSAANLLLKPGLLQEFDNMHPYIFMYDRVNGYSIGYDADTVVSNDQIVNFFLGNNNFKGGQVNGGENDYTSFKFYFWKEHPKLVIKKSRELLQGYAWTKYSRRRPDKDKPNKFSRVPSDLIQWQKILLKQEFTTTSGVKVINNEDVPSIAIDSKVIRFERALKRLLIDPVIQKNQSDLVDVISKYKLKDNNEKSIMLNAYEMSNSAKSLSDGIFLDQKQLNLLNKSKILAVYGVFKNDEGKESLIWGLAEVPDESQPSGKRKFHWVTDIKCDISELLKS